MNTIKKMLVLVFILFMTYNGADKITVLASGTSPYFYVENDSEMNRISKSAANVEYNRGYYMAPEKNLEKIYKITVLSKGYLTFTANNPYKKIYNTTLKTTLSILEPSGNCLWFHDYDYNYENTNLHSYRIGLDTGVYYFYLKNNSHYLKNATTSLLYNFKFTETGNFEIEPNNNRLMAHEYVFGKTIQGEYGCKAEKIIPEGIADDYYELHFVKGRSYNITFEMYHKGLYRTSFYLENSNGKKLATGGDLVSNKYTYKCKKTGIYYLHVGNNTISAISIIQPYSFCIDEDFTSPKTKISKVNRKGKNATITWKTVSGVTGYQIQYGSNKKTLKKNKLITIADNKTAKQKLSGLNRKKTYYIRIRTYTKSYNKTVKSSFSKIVKIDKASGSKSKNK